MSDYDNTDKGALFKNDKKETDSHPDYKGSINVEGKDYWLSSWINTSKKGVKYMSLSVQSKEESHQQGVQHAQKQMQQPAQQQPEQPQNFDDESIPF